MKQLMKQLIIVLIALVMGLIMNHWLIADYLLIYVHVPQGYELVYFCLSWLGLALLIYSLLFFIIKGYLPITIFIILTIGYWILMVGLLFFKTTHTQGINLNIIAFIKYSLYDKTTLFINLLNIVLFMPIGMYLRHFKLTCLKSVLISVFIIMFIEVVQFVYAVGIFDIGDVLLNECGIVIGYILPFYFAYQPYRIIIKVGYAS